MSISDKLEKHGVKILYAATLAGLGFSFLGSVKNSHLLSPESFGDWKYLQNYVVLISYFVNFGLYSSGGRLIAATNDKIKVRIYKGYMLYFAFAGMLVIILSTIISGLFLPKILNHDLFQLAIVIFPFFIINPLNFYFEATFQGERKLVHLAIFRFLPPLAYISLLYAFESHSKGSIYYNAILYYASYFVVYMMLIWSDKPIFKRNTNEWADLKAQHKSYGIHLYWGGLWGVGAIYLLPVLVGFFGINNVAVGHYSLALSLITPLALLPSIVGTAYFKQFITIKTIPPNAFNKVLLASVVSLVALLVGVDWFVDLVLDKKYQEVGSLIKIGSFGAILHGLGDFVNKFLLAKGESVYLKKVSIAVGLVQLISSLLLIKVWSSTGGIIAKSLGSIVFFSALFFYYRKKYIVEGSEGIKIKLKDDEDSLKEEIPAG
jgi:O-antigen/teichoic acid export membrane protein